MTNHSLFGSPSALARHEQCPGNVSYCRDLPDLPVSEYAKEGTEFHELIKKYGEHVLKNDGEYSWREPEEIGNYIAETTFRIKEIWKGFCETHTECKYFLEFPVKLNKHIYGTADVVFTGVNIKSGLRDLIVVDYKYGKGVVVNAYENLQGIAYLLAARRTLKASFVGRGKLFIAQVRLDNGWSEYEISGFNEWFRWEQKLKKIVSKVQKIYKNTHLVERNLCPGEHCRFCKGNGICVAQKKQLHDQLQLTATEPDIQEIIKHLSLDDQVKIFLKKSVIEDFLDAVAKNLTKSFEMGITHPGLKLIKAKGRRNWKKFSEEELKELAHTLVAEGARWPLKTSLVGITEIEKQIGRGKLDEYTEISEGKLQLVKAEDIRTGIEYQELEELPL